MRLKAVTGICVTDQELARRQARYDSLAPPGVKVDLVNLSSSPSTPRRADSSEDVYRAAKLVLEELLSSSSADYDAVFPDCMMDPGVIPARAESTVPVLGILHLSANYLAALGLPFVVVTRNVPIAEEVTEVIGAYGLSSSLRDVVVIDLGFDEIAAGDAWNTALANIPARLGSDVRILNGCTAVHVDPGREQEQQQHRVIDPLRLAFSLIGAGRQVS